MRVRARFTLPVALVIAALAAWAQPAGATEIENYALESVSASLSSSQAGAHADFTTTFKLTEKQNKPYALTRDIEFHLPPGLIGNPQGIPRCTVIQLGDEVNTSKCPVGSQVGVSDITVGDPINGTLTEPIYNMTPPGGDVVARLGFFAGLYPAFVNLRVDPNDYSIVAAVEGAPAAAEVLGGETTIWGVPAAPVHDGLRLTPVEAREHKLPKEGRSAGLPETPFLSNPTDCSLQRQLTVTARSYQLPDQSSTMSAPFPQITGCGKLTFEPIFKAIPTNPEAA